MSFTSGDVPKRVDVLINGEGYCFAEPEDVEAEYSYTPSFVQRSNTQGDFGDNYQDFFFTYTQNDFSLGEGQRYFRRDADRKRRCWDTTNCSVFEPGKVFLNYDKETITASARYSPVALGSGIVYYWGGSGGNLYHYTSGTEISDGAHGLGAKPWKWASTTDGQSLYVSSESAGSVGVRRFNTVTAAFSTFSASTFSGLCFNNNTLFGYSTGNNALYYLDSSGTANLIYQWKEADGTSYNLAFSELYSGKLLPYGGKVVLLKPYSELTGDFTGDLYLCDTSGVQLVAKMPGGFTPNDMTVAFGSVFIGGSQNTTIGDSRPSILVWQNGSLETLWIGVDRGASVKSLAPFASGIAFTDGTNGLRFYDLASGAVNSIATGFGTVANEMAGTQFSVLSTGGSGSGSTFSFPSSTAQAATATITTSLEDFESALTKVFRGITIEYDAGTPAATFDIAYRVDDVDGSYTTLQTGAVSGTEYTLSGVTGRSISVKVTINKGTGSFPPTSVSALRRVSVRAVPKQQSYRRNTYVFALGGRDGYGHQQLRSGELHPKDGYEQAVALTAVAAAGTPVTIVDEMGSFTGVIENEGFRLRRFRRNEFIAVVPVRGV